jgi:ribosomal-protein-alanine N-acetyltransferase
MPNLAIVPEMQELTRRPVAPVAGHWRQQLPVLRGDQVVLREARESDAESLLTLIGAPEVSRFISEPPESALGFERFIGWTQEQRAAGTHVCYAVTLRGFDTAIGIFQVREIEPGFAAAEWGFAIGSPFWGTGVFQEAACLVLDFVFGTLGAHRLEARAAVKNGRGHAALQKIGAAQEGVLRRSLLRDGEYVDQALYAIVEDDWRANASPRGLRLVHGNIH